MVQVPKRRFGFGEERKLNGLRVNQDVCLLTESTLYLIHSLIVSTLTISNSERNLNDSEVKVVINSLKAFFLEAISNFADL